jgi:hypothetical protein
MLRTFGPKRKEVAGGWRRVHNEELQNLYIAPNIIREIKSRRLRWPGHVAHMGEVRNAYKILVRKPVWKRPFGRPMHIWEDNIRKELTEIVWVGVEGMHLAQDEHYQDLVNIVMNFQVP